jgi:propanol-preferring alcohol dehydrogenase
VLIAVLSRAPVARSVCNESHDGAGAVARAARARGQRDLGRSPAASAHPREGCGGVPHRSAPSPTASCLLCRLPVIRAHEVVGVGRGRGRALPRRARARSACLWLGWTCGACDTAGSDRENLCDRARIHPAAISTAGMRDEIVADERFLRADSAALQRCARRAAPVRGLIGYRSLRQVREARRTVVRFRRAAAHPRAGGACRRPHRCLLLPKSKTSNRQRFASCVRRPRGRATRRRRRRSRLDAAIVFAPRERSWSAPERGRKGGRVICGGIHMSDIPSFPIAFFGASAASNRWRTSPAPTASGFMQLAAKRPAARPR